MLHPLRLRHRSTAAYTDRVELEERTIEQLPDRCQNCGAKLTDAEKRAALVEGPPSGLVLCTTCAAEVVPVDEDEEAEAAG
jgi:hypothetical protein